MPRRHKPPYPDAEQAARLRRLEEAEARAGLRRSIFMKYFDMALIGGGIPAVGIYVLTNPEIQSPQGLGTIGVIVTLLTVARTGADQIGKWQHRKEANGHG